MRKFYAVYPTWNAVRSELIFWVAVYVDVVVIWHAHVPKMNLQYLKDIKTADMFTMTPINS